jgi:hypothetical protein
MKHPGSFFLAAVLVLCASFLCVAQVGTPDLEHLKQVAQLPSELPQRIEGLAYDGKKLWATLYLGRGRYARLDPSTLKWEASDDDEQHKAIRNVSGAFESPGAICFAGSVLWIGGAYGNSFGAIDLETWKVKQVFKGKQVEDPASQAYSSIAYDGNNIWIAWHWFRYDLPTGRTQLLLKLDPESGKVLMQYALPPGTPSDATHALTWDGVQLWHMKDNRLSAIDSSSGEVTAQYIINPLKRPSGMAWIDDVLWIAEFDGKIWRLPFRK